MNIFLNIGNIVHGLTFFVVLLKLGIYNSAAGLSARTQVLLCLVYTTRYLDLLSSPINRELKVLFLFLSYLTTVLIYTKYRKTYEKHLDTFFAEVIVMVAVVLAFLCHYQYTYMEVAWACSQYLECMAAWPQFYMISKTRTVTRMTFVYLLGLGSYRSLYIANWVYRYYVEDHKDLISSVPGTVQVVPYFVFWILCIFQVIRITSDKTSWLGQNLKDVGDGQIFTIDVPEKYNEKWGSPDVEPRSDNIKEPLIAIGGN